MAWLAFFWFDNKHLRPVFSYHGSVTMSICKEKEQEEQKEMGSGRGAEEGGGGKGRRSRRRRRGVGVGRRRFLQYLNVPRSFENATQYTMTWKLIEFQMLFV